MLKSLRHDLRDLRVEVRELSSKQHERLSTLEQWRWKWVGGLAVAVFVVEIIVKLVIEAK